MTTTAETLRTAATRLRALAANATPGPWTIREVPPYTDPLLLSRFEETPDDGDVLIAGNIDVEPADQAYIATMHPAVGLALADVLDVEANVVDDMARQSPDLTDEQLSAHAHGLLTIARALLGEVTR